MTTAITPEPRSRTILLLVQQVEDVASVAALCALLLEGSSYDAGDGGTGTDGSGQYGNNAVRLPGQDFKKAERCLRSLTVKGFSVSLIRLAGRPRTSPAE